MMAVDGTVLILVVLAETYKPLKNHQKQQPSISRLCQKKFALAPSGWGCVGTYVLDVVLRFLLFSVIYRLSPFSFYSVSSDRFQRRGGNRY
jgi:hypothetical protein